MKGKWVIGGLVAILSACSSPQKQESTEDIEAKAKWEFYGGKVNYDKGIVEGGYLNQMHDVANLSLGMAKSAEEFEYTDSLEDLESLVRYGLQAEFAATNIKSVYEKKETAKEEFPTSWHERLDFSFQLLLNKFLIAYDTLDSAWKKSDNKIKIRDLQSENYDMYMTAKSYFSEASLIMRAYRDLVTKVKVRLPEELSSHRQHER